MKSGSLPNNFPAGAEAWEKLIAAAPGEDREPTLAETHAWKSVIVSRSLEEFKEKQVRYSCSASSGEGLDPDTRRP